MNLTRAVESRFSEQGLPVSQHLAHLLSELSNNELVALKAPPGSGKTLLCPMATWESKLYKQVHVLEPRRVTARLPALALREVCDELVGYRIRRDKLLGPATRVLFQTYGMALQVFSKQPPGPQDLVIFDEFHERPWQAELLFALLRAREKSPRILLMSATLDHTILPKATPFIESDGRLHPVKLSWEKSDTVLGHDKLLLAQLVAERSQELVDPDGEQLIFLPGKAELLATQKLLEADTLPGPVEILHSSVRESEIHRIVSRPGGKGFRRILSTDIAESSVTLPGITVVIDSGLARCPFREKLGLGASLRTQRAPRSALEQRAGRAGRLSKGHCHRLFSKSSESDREAYSPSGIRQAEPESLALTLAAYQRLNDWPTLPWLEDPDRPTMERAIQELRRLELLDARFELNRRGRIVFALPLHPRLGAFAVRARESGMAHTTISRVCQAIDGETSSLTTLSEKIHQSRSQKGDTYLDSRLSKELSKVSGTATDRSISELLLEAFQPNLAQFRKQRALSKLADQRALLWEGEPGMTPSIGLILAIAPSSRPGVRTRVTLFHPLESSLVWETLFDELEEQESLEWDNERKRFRRFNDTTIGQLLLERQALKLEPSAELAVSLMGRFSEQIHGESSLLERLRLLLNYRPELLPSLSRQLGSTLLEDSSSALKALKLSFLSTVLNWEKSSPQRLDEYTESILPHEIRTALHRELPSHVNLPGRRRPVAIQYPADSLPFLASKLQDFMNWNPPKLLRGQLKLQFHLLAPNGRPAQVTDDLSGFWSGSYVQVRKDLRGRYPKHHWPEANELLKE